MSDLFDWIGEEDSLPKVSEEEAAYRWLLSRGGVAKATDFAEEFFHKTFVDLQTVGRATTVTFEGDGDLYYTILM